MSKRIAIVQSNYIPWKGYFDLINMVDEFILYDEMQYTRRDWRNRNLIKTPPGLKWLTIPVKVKDKYFQKINETKLSDLTWAKKQWATIVHSYSKAKYFKEYRDLFEELYLNCREEYLSQVNFRFISEICQILKITTKISWSRDYGLVEGKTERLVDLCKKAEATEYLSGPSAKDYMDEELFRDAGISIQYIDYSGYPVYHQLYPPFQHGVSIIDLIFSEGPNVSKYMKSF